LKTLKHKIGFSFLLLAGLIILAHQVIPHHHYYAFDHDFHKKNSGKIIWLSVNSKNDGVHCCAFNELYNDKKTIFNPVKYLQQLHFDCLSLLTEQIIFRCGGSFDFLVAVFSEIDTSHFFKSIQLRAPPLSLHLFFFQTTQSGK